MTTLSEAIEQVRGELKEAREKLQRESALLVEDARLSTRAHTLGKRQLITRTELLLKAQQVQVDLARSLVEAKKRHLERLMELQEEYI